MRTLVQPCKVCGREPQANRGGGMGDRCISRFSVKDLRELAEYFRRWYPGNVSPPT